MSREADSALAMQNAITHRLMEHFRLSERHASEHAAVAMAALSEGWGGERVYIPKATVQAPSADELKGQHDGSAASRDALCKRYGWSVSTFYRKLREAKDG